jgi:Protein of unknown function (DUF2971)
MKLYKYRSLKNMEFVLDILLNERLHCAPYSELNDPFEGMFFSCFYPSDPLFKIIYKPGTKIRTPKSVTDIPFLFNKSKICSLSATLSDVRLWSYYADGHQGIALEIDFSGREGDIKAVSYVSELQERGSTLLEMISTSSEEVLSFKTTHWLYEQEYRIVQEGEYYPIPGRITAIYGGINISDSHLDLLRKIVPRHIPIIQTKINPHTLEIEPNRGRDGL